MTRPLLSILLACCFGSCCFLACAPSVPDARPNLVLVFADDWSWPHAGAYGDAAVRTPHFDELAERGTLFTHAFTSSPSCTPSRGALLTGQHFFRLGSAANLWGEWPEDLDEYPALLEESGYHVGSVGKGWGPGRHPGREHNPAGRRFATVEDFLEKRRQRPFALWFGSRRPHRPYERGSGKAAGVQSDRAHLFGHLPDVPEVRDDIADYYAAVEHFDQQLGALLRTLSEDGELERTWVVVTSDHGMPFPRAKGNLYDAGTRVPLVMAPPPGVSRPAKVDDLVSLIDLAPTLLQLAGVETPRAMNGSSLTAYFAADRVPEPRRDVVFGRERHLPAQVDGAANPLGYPMRGLRTTDFLYVRNAEPERWPAGAPERFADCDDGPSKAFLWRARADARWSPFYELAFAKRPAEELYDLASNPDQVVNVADDADYAAVRKEMAERLDSLLRSAEDPRITGRGEQFDRAPFRGPNDSGS